MEKNFIKISEYAERMSLHIRTAYRYFHLGKIEGFQDEETKTIFIKNPFSEKNCLKILTKNVPFYMPEFRQVKTEQILKHRWKD